MASETLVGTSVAARVNLLPPEIAEHRKVQQVYVGLAAAALGAAAVVGMLVMVQAGKVSDAKSDLAVAHTEQAKLQQRFDSLQYVRTLNAKVDAHKALVVEAMGQEVRWSGYLNDLGLRIPANVWVTKFHAVQNLDGAAATTTAAGGPSLVPAGIGEVTVSGKAFEHTDVAAWLDTLARQKGYSNAYFSKSEVDTGIKQRQIINFETSVTLTPQALSKRFVAKPAGSK